MTRPVTWDDAILAALTPEAEAATRAIAARPAWASLAPTPAEVWQRYGAAIVRAHPEVWSTPQLAPAGVRYFASGTNDGEAILGLAQLGIAVGVSVEEIGPAALDALAGAADGLHLPALFLDSGAFSERATGKPITDWPERLLTYAAAVRGCTRAARWFAPGELDEVPTGCAVYVVAPDCVGDQVKTLRRLHAYRDEVRELARLGARVIVPVQRGDLSLADFWRAELAILGPGDWIAGIPCKRSATCPAAFARFAREARPRAVHFLGLGPTRGTFGAFLAAARAVGAEVSCDSGLLRRLAGATNGRNGGPRAITAARAQLGHLGDLATFAAAILGVAESVRPAVPAQLPLLDQEAA